MDVKRIQTVICIDQQGGKSNANYQIDIACTILSDSHGTPHAVAIIYEEDSNRKKVKANGKELKGST